MFKRSDKESLCLGEAGKGQQKCVSFLKHMDMHTTVTTERYFSYKNFYLCTHLLSGKSSTFRTINRFTPYSD